MVSPFFFAALGLPRRMAAAERQAGVTRLLM